MSAGYILQNEIFLRLLVQTVLQEIADAQNAHHQVILDNWEMTDLEDLVQETLISVHTRRTSYDRTRPFTAWLYAIARYRMVDHYRRQKLSAPVEELDDILMTENFEEALSASMDVETLLGMVSIKQARAIRETHIAGKSVAEAAADAEIGESDVKISVHRGLKAIVKRLAGN